MSLLWWKERRLRTVWKVEKKHHSSFLVGTAHFAPYSFKKSLTKLIQGVDTVLFEGPLDQESMARVVEYGQKGENSPSLYEALDPEAIKQINRQLSVLSGPSTTTGSYLDLIHRTGSDPLERLVHGVRPWMGFFTIWSAFLNWRHSMDVEAFRIAQKLGKKIRYLETIEDQLAALDGIPFERIVKYLNDVKHWGGHKKAFMRAFLGGDTHKFFSMTGEFPTRCESIIAKRDPIFFERMKAHFEENRTTAFVGVAHIPGIQKMFLGEGYRVIQVGS